MVHRGDDAFGLREAVDVVVPDQPGARIGVGGEPEIRLGDPPAERTG
jgi:hypothetical protein